jgi:hypothetical protein
MLPLSRLHRVLQVVMGWEDYHLHQFVVGDTYYGPPDPEAAFAGLETRSERHARLAQVAPAVGSVVVYEYDFGDGWRVDKFPDGDVQVLLAIQVPPWALHIAEGRLLLEVEEALLQVLPGQPIGIAIEAAPKSGDDT